MYDAFDDFLQRETWHTRHENDKDQFFRSLETVVYNPQFNADRLGEYIDQRREAGENAQAGILQLEYDEARNYYVDAAWARLAPGKEIKNGGEAHPWPIPPEGPVSRSLLDSPPESASGRGSCWRERS